MKNSTKKRTARRFASKIDLKFESTTETCTCNHADAEPCIVCWAGLNGATKRKASPARSADHRARIKRVRDALKRHGLPSTKEAAIQWFVELVSFDADEYVERWLAAGFINPVIVGDLWCACIYDPDTASRAIALVHSVRRKSPIRDRDVTELLHIVGLEDGHPTITGAVTLNGHRFPPKVA